MTGKEALTYLQAGYTLRRKDWKPGHKCKAYFSDDLWSIRLEIDDPRLDTLDPDLAPQWVPEKPEYSDYMSVFDAIDGGEFLYDDWEIADQDNDIEPQIIKTNSDKAMYFSERFEYIFSDAWCNQKYIDQVKSLSKTLTEIYPENLSLPYIFPYDYNSITFEWHINNNDATLEVKLETMEAEWHNLNFITNQEDEMSYDLSNTENWIVVFNKLYDLFGTKPITPLADKMIKDFNKAIENGEIIP